MDRRDLVENLQRAFNEDNRIRNTIDSSDVEYKENTNTLYVKEHKTFDTQTKDRNPREMSEEEVFKRLLKDRR